MYDDLGTDLLLLRFTAIFRPSPPPPPKKIYQCKTGKKFFLHNEKTGIPCFMHLHAYLVSSSSSSNYYHYYC